MAPSEGQMSVRYSPERCSLFWGGVPVIMGQGALNQGVSKTEIPDKSQMSGTKPQMALTTDKWLPLAPFAPFRRFVHPLIELPSIAITPVYGRLGAAQDTFYISNEESRVYCHCWICSARFRFKRDLFSDFKSGNYRTMTI